MEETAFTLRGSAFARIVLIIGLEVDEGERQQPAKRRLRPSNHEVGNRAHIATFDLALRPHTT